MSHSPEFEALCQRARARIGEASVADIRAKQLTGQPFVLVDVREDNEWDRGHITGAIHLGRGIIERDIVATIPNKDTELVLYCGGGFRSALSADNLQQMGYTRVLSMAGGWKAWNTAGLPTTAK